MTWGATLIQVEVALSAVVAWAFVLMYGFRSPWRATVVGRSLMYVWVSLAVILTLITGTFWFGEYPGREWVRLAVYTPLPVALGKFLWVLVQVQRGRMRGEIPSRVDTKL